MRTRKFNQPYFEGKGARWLNSGLYHHGNVAVRKEKVGELLIGVYMFTILFIFSIQHNHLKEHYNGIATTSLL